MENIHFLLMKSNALLSKKILKQANKIGLSPGQPKILEYLSTHGEAEQKAIAAYCEIEQTTVGNILWRMEDIGLIIRKKKPGNRRSVYVSLTETGKEYASELSLIFASAEKAVLADFSKEEIEMLLNLLNKLYNSMKKEAIE